MNFNSPATLARLEFLGAPDEPEQLAAYLWQLLATTIKAADSAITTRSKLEQLFADDIGLVRSLYSDSAPQIDSTIAEKLYGSVQNHQTFAQAALNYYASQSRLPIIVFDNVDQLRIESQVQIFTVCHHLAKMFACLSVLVLREESYSTALMKKHLTAYTFHAYHLSSPSFKILLKLRIDVAVRTAVTAKDAITVPAESERYQQIIDLFRLVRKSILGPNKNIIRLVQSLAYGNMRLALKLFNDFITSGATDMRKILTFFARGINYTVPFHEFIKSVMLGDYRYYKEERSTFANLFAVTPYPNASHFTALRLLSYLSIVGDPRSGGEGFANLHQVLNATIDLFNNEEDCKATLL